MSHLQLPQSYLLTSREFADDDAQMFVLEFPNEISIRYPRIFMISSNAVTQRGRHAHKECLQVLISTTSEIKIESRFGARIKQFTLRPFLDILVVPPLNWITLDLPENGALVVMASQKFSENDYLRDYDEYLRYLNQVIKLSQEIEI